VGPILPLHLPHFYEPQVSLINQGRRLQRLPRAFLPQVTGGESPQFVVDEGQQGVQCPCIAAVPSEQQIRWCRARARNGPILRHAPPGRWFPLNKPGGTECRREHDPGFR
jgi:hypothetical protein